MFVGELPTMDEPGGDEGLTFDLDYSFQKMNLSAREITQVSLFEFLLKIQSYMHDALYVCGGHQSQRWNKQQWIVSKIVTQKTNFRKLVDWLMVNFLKDDTVRLALVIVFMISQISIYCHFFVD